MTERKTKIVPVIMSGGSGTRLWPLSTDAVPKQFQTLASELSMIQETALRVRGAAAVDFLPPVVICNGRHEHLVHEQLGGLDIQPLMLVLEPFGRNTAAVAAIAAALVRERYPDALVLLLPADHVIADVAGFQQVVAEAATAADSHIVTFGIVPTGPDTGYGYVEQGEALTPNVFAVRAFKEKPSADLAQSYLDHGGYYWNAGIFLYSPEVLLREMRVSRADIADAALATVKVSTWRGHVLPLDEVSFAQCPSESIDYAVMEKTAWSAVAPCSIGWADVGSWSELWRLGPSDANGNVIRGRAITLDTKGCLIWSEKRLITAIGVEDLVIVETDEAIIVLPKSRAQDVKAIVTQVAQSAKAAAASADVQPVVSRTAP